ncbi:hypothetical protein [Paralimibaculum aggregatum]|nr:hypothetical protein [Limibaculum sp. NKW23]
MTRSIAAACRALALAVPFGLPAVLPAALPIALPAALVAAVPAPGAADAPALSIELNRLEPSGAACQAYMVMENGTDARFESLALDLVLFDAEGIIVRRLAVELGPVAAAKMRVKVFGIDGLACDAIGRILVNGVVSCDTGAGARDDCAGMIRTRSRASAEFLD